MAFELDIAGADAGPLDVQIRGRLARLAEKASAALDAAAFGAPDERAAAAFEARRCAKRARALLRLARPALAKSVYAAENDAWRDAARALSPLRDVSANAALCRRLALASDRPVLARAYADLAAEFDAEERGRVGGREGMDGMETASRILRVRRARAQDLPIIDPSAEAIVGGARKTYAKGRAEMRAAGRHPTDDAAHDWRKRVKHHAFQMRLLRPLDAPELLAREDAAKAAARALGDMHDIAVFQAALEARPRVSSAARPDLHRDLDRRRDRLRIDAFAFADRLFAEKPRRFAAMLAEAAARRRAGFAAPRIPATP